MKRIHSIDIVRGLVMILMALDHTRDLMHASNINPLDVDKTTPLLFFTRWITHLCAPTFVFLSGTSAYLGSRKDFLSARRFLVTRGLWLIILEVTLINFLFWADIHFRILFLQVIFAIGAGFLLLSLLLRVQARWLAVLGLVLIAGHNLVKGGGPFDFLFFTSITQVTPHFTFAYLYPVLPWFGIMLTGFACGPLFLREHRGRLFLGIGVAALALFALLRWINRYGDPFPWTADHAFLSFMNVTKNPPSLLYTLVTLGIMFLLLAAAEGRDNRFTRFLEVYGRVPMYYYLWHIFLIHTAMFIMDFALGFGPKDLVFGPFLFGNPPGAGISLGGVYLVWIAVVAVAYPICVRWGRYKAAHRENVWLRYL
ncbi:DUF1624 domain-containing protein [Dinghuibacter silviterrae]|uniref:Putative membrane protein n=1 Tax=Dinghuibacter silviterrae TaxID=1539049 RepID=A0A4R8DSK9_9BACT|nr:heparan-alpha-glucosaminide N-acetyltransferase domain-containing protein [Dinghuibacter silviterrae]TDX00856.1 putative membrane protein [Dinghuibacter silviterrae]